MSEESTVESTFQAIKDRLAHPIFGNFIIIFLIWNWKAVFYLATQTKKGAADKIQFVLDNYWNKVDVFFRCNISGWGNFWVPVGLTFLYLAAYPIITSGYRWFSNWSSKGLNKESDIIESEEAERKSKKLAFDVEGKEKKINELDQRFQAVSSNVSNQNAELIKINDEIVKLSENKKILEDEVKRLKHEHSQECDLEKILHTYNYMRDLIKNRSIFNLNDGSISNLSREIIYKTLDDLVDGKAVDEGSISVPKLTKQ